VLTRVYNISNGFRDRRDGIGASLAVTITLALPVTVVVAI